MENMKIEVYGNSIARIANNQVLQNEFYLKYNKFIDEFIYLNDRIYNKFNSDDKENNRNDIGTYIKDTISKLQECDKLIKDIEANDDYESDVEVPYKLICSECGTELKLYEIDYCERCLEDKINEFENENNLR